MIESIVGFAKEWGLNGVIILSALTATGWAGKLGIEHLIKQVRQNRELREKEISGLKRNITELHRLLNIERLECRESSLVDARIQSSLLALAVKVHTMLGNAFSGKRKPPAEFDDVSKELRELRLRMHDATNARAERVMAMRREMKLPEL